jgi:hypothetical protein
MNATNQNRPPPRLPGKPRQHPLAAIPGGALPMLHAAPPHDLLVLSQNPDLTPEHFARLIRVAAAG